MTAELLRAIIDHPADTELRLVYADWLEQHGELERASVIRTECALADVPAYDYRWIAHWSWVSAHRAAQPLPRLPAGIAWHPFGYRRGFPERIYVNDPDAFVAHDAALFALAPIRSLEIDARGPAFSLDRLLASKWLERITHLCFKLGQFGSEHIRKIVESAHLANVTSFAFAFEGVTGDGLRALLQSPFAQQLTELDVTSNFFIEHGRPLEAFRDASLPRLRHLDVERNRMDATTLGAITDNPSLRLARLSLFDNPLGDAGWRVLARSPLRLEHLDLGKTHPRLEGVRELAAAPQATTLRFLKLDLNRLGPQAAAVLAATRWPELEFLDASSNRFGSRGMTALMSAAGFPKLLRADVHEREVTAKLHRKASAWFESTELMRSYA